MQKDTPAIHATCQMWIGQGEDCGKPAKYRVRKAPGNKPGVLLCDEHCEYYKERPEQYVVIQLEAAP